MEVINLNEKLSRFHDHWQPRIVGELNGQHVKIAKIKGEFVWHSHEDADELFLIISGRLTMCLEDGDLSFGEGEMVIVPKGIRHKPVAEEECHIMMFEPAGTVNTGDTGGDRTVDPVWV